MPALRCARAAASNSSAAAAADETRINSVRRRMIPIVSLLLVQLLFATAARAEAHLRLRLLARRALLADPLAVRFGTVLHLLLCSLGHARTIKRIYARVDNL